MLHLLQLIPFEPFTCRLAHPCAELGLQVMLLSQGRVAYQGAGQQALKYFESIGHSLPSTELVGPAEFILTLVRPCRRLSALHVSQALMHAHSFNVCLALSRFVCM